MILSTARTLWLAMIGLALLAGCSQLPSTPPVTVDESIAPPQPKVNYPSAGINQFIVDFYNTIQDNNLPNYIELWNIDEYANRIIGNIDMTDYVLRSVKSGLINDQRFIKTTISNNLSQLVDSQLFLLETDLQTPSVKFRIAKGEDSFHLTFLLEAHDDQYRIIDVVDHAVGMTQSEKSGFIQGLVYKVTSQEKAIANRIFSATQLLQQGNPAEAKAQLDALPDNYLRDKTVLGIYIQVATALDQQAVLGALELVERFHANDPLVSYLMSSLFIMREQPLEAINALESYLKVIGPDAEIEFIIGELYLANGMLDDALRHANRSIRIDSSFHDSYWLLARIFLQKQEWETSIAALDVLKQYFGYNFTPAFFEEDIEFQSIRQQTAFQHWVTTLSNEG